MQRMLAQGALAALLVGGVVTAASADDLVYACLKKDGKVSEMSVTGAPTCRKGEDLVFWSKTGSKGDQGPKGDPGVPGPAGATNVVSFSDRTLNVDETDGLVFVGATHDVTLTDGQRVTAAITSVLGPAVTFSLPVVELNICHKTAGGIVSPFETGRLFFLTSVPPSPYTVTATHVFSVGGTYTIGFCANVYGEYGMSVETIQGWAIIS